MSKKKEKPNFGLPSEIAVRYDRSNVNEAYLLASEEGIFGVMSACEEAEPVGIYKLVRVYPEVTPTYDLGPHFEAVTV